MSGSDDDLGRLRRTRGVLARRRRWVRVGLAVAVVAVVAGLVWLLAFSPVLALRRVAVTGTSLLSVEEVTTRAQAPMGRPLPRVDERQVADRVATLPQVARVTVVRHWPNALEVRVTERVPAYVLNRDGRWMLVDATGVMFVSVAERPEGLVEVHGDTADQTVLKELADVVSTMPEPMRQQVERIEVGGRDGVNVRLRGDREVFYGSGEQAALKGQVADSLLRGTRARSINVSAPGHPTVR